jgi:hypothetical protein
MDFIQAQESNCLLMPQEWQRNTYDTTGDTFYAHLASGRMVFKFNDICHQDNQKKRAVTPVQAKLATIEEPLPDKNAVSRVVNMFSTPCRSFKDGTLLKPAENN